MPEISRLCTRCGIILDPVLTDAGYQTHPCCDATEEPSKPVQPARFSLLRSPIAGE